VSVSYSLPFQNFSLFFEKKAKKYRRDAGSQIFCFFKLLFWILSFPFFLVRSTICSNFQAVKILCKSLRDEDVLDGKITSRKQIEAVNIKFHESQLEAIPQCLLQFHILWNINIEDVGEIKWISLTLSLVSVSKGSFDYLRFTLSGNKMKPELKQLPKSLLFMSHFLMVFMCYSLLMVVYREYSCILFGVHLFASVILAAVFTENLFLFIYTSLAGVFSPVLYADQKDFITEPSDLIRVSSESQHYYRFSSILSSASCFTASLFLIGGWWTGWVDQPRLISEKPGSLNNETFNEGFQPSPPEVSK